MTAIITGFALWKTLIDRPPSVESLAAALIVSFVMLVLVVVVETVYFAIAGRGQPPAAPSPPETRAEEMNAGVVTVPAGPREVPELPGPVGHKVTLLKHFVSSVLSTGWGRLGVVLWGAWLAWRWWVFDGDDGELFVTGIAFPAGIAVGAWWVRQGFLSPEDRQKKKEIWRQMLRRVEQENAGAGKNSKEE
jgi:hypothetical protein